MRFTLYYYGICLVGVSEVMVDGLIGSLIECYILVPQDTLNRFGHACMRL